VHSPSRAQLNVSISGPSVRLVVLPKARAFVGGICNVHWHGIHRCRAHNVRAAPVPVGFENHVSESRIEAAPVVRCGLGDELSSLKGAEARTHKPGSKDLTVQRDR